MTQAMPRTLLRVLRSVGLITALILVQVCGAYATSLIVYSGADVGASAPGVNSTTAATSFDTAAAAIGSGSIITFESPLVATNSRANQTIVLTSGVSVTGGDIDIRNTPSCSLSLCGDNTTAGGSQWLDIFGGTATFSFTHPIQYFGAYLGGLQGTAVGQETITFSDGSVQTVNIPMIDSGFAFVGFTDAGASITSVSIDTSGDIISVDDLRFGPTTAVPEPATLALLAAGLTGFALRRKLR